MIVRDHSAIMNGIVKNLEYPRHDDSKEAELQHQAERIWKAIREKINSLAKAEVLRGRDIAEIEERDGTERILVIYHKMHGDEFKSFAVPREVCQYQVILRMAMCAEPYGFKIYPSKKAIGSGKWTIEFVR